MSGCVSFWEALLQSYARVFASTIDPVGITLVAVTDGAMARCGRCARGRIFWRAHGGDRFCRGFRSFVMAHAGCQSQLTLPFAGAAAVDRGAVSRDPRARSIPPSEVRS